MGYITSSLFGLLSRLAPTIPPVSSGGSGTPGADGADGEDAFVYIAYASDASGTGFTTTYDSGLDYIAIRSTTTAIASPVAGDFAGLWKKYKGEPGTNGTNGTNGIDGTFGNQYQGDYVGGNSYVVDDIVTDGGGSYLCVTNDPSSASAPSAGNINWVAIAEKGATGAAGSSGGVSGSATKTGSTYTLDSAEANKNVLFSNSTGCTITVGANASTDFDQWYLMHRGTSGQVTLSASGSTIVGPISTGAPGDTLQLVQVNASVYHSFLHPGGNINTLTTDSSPNTAADYVRTWDASASCEKKVLLEDIGGGTSYILIQDQKSVGTSGGTFTSGAYRTRTLNTEVADAGGHASISSNQITLAAGTYRFNISCPAYAVGRHQAILYNISDSSVVAVGTSEYAPVTVSETTSRSIISGRVTIASTKVFEVQHKGTTTSATYGFGVECSFTTEVYTSAEFWKEA